MNRPDVAIVGAGIIGCAIARHAARAGARVCVLERGRPGMEATWAAAGMLSPQAEAVGPGPLLSLMLQSRSRYPDLASALHRESGIDIGYDETGTLLLAFSDDDEREVDARFRWQSAAGLQVERLRASDVLGLEPNVSNRVRCGLHFPGDHQVDNRSLGRAMWTSAAKAGARFILGAEGARVLRSGERVTGVELHDGERVEAGAVIIAGGSWAGRIEGLPRPLPVAPVHGQLLGLDTVPAEFRHVIDSPRCYLVPRTTGRLIVGATVERIGFTRTVTAAGMLELLSGAVEIAPCLGASPVAEIWSGLRPGTPDGLPILGPDPEVPNLIYATGHYRNGILLAPLTGEAIGELVTSGTSPVDLYPFGPERFPVTRNRGDS